MACFTLRIFPLLDFLILVVRPQIPKCRLILAFGPHFLCSTVAARLKTISAETQHYWKPLCSQGADGGFPDQQNASPGIFDLERAKARLRRHRPTGR
jgi:hypothetical protein